ncbi:hypothetical protein KR054_001545, partial [Drosophila jambulina]
SSLLEYFLANLLLDIQHELLYERIQSVSQLRHLVRTREAFMQSVGSGHNKPRPAPPRFVQAVEATGEYDSDSEEEISALNLICWSCKSSGYRYQEWHDRRPYAEIILLDRQISGLMDTGASISCIGGELAKELLENGVEFRKMSTKVHSAGGQAQEIIGKFKTINPSNHRQRKYYGELRMEQRDIISAIVGHDRRPYAEIILLDRQISGLMDTGASISCIGGELAKELLENGVEFRKMSTKVHSAGGQAQEIIGKFKTIVEYKGIK